MSEQGKQKCNEFHDWFASLPVMRIFRCFRIAAQPGKMILALIGITLICLVGWTMDWMTPSSFRAVVSSSSASEMASARNELEAYVSGQYKIAGSNLETYKNTLRGENEERLRQLLSSGTLQDTFPAVKSMELAEVLSKVNSEYGDKINPTFSVLRKSFQNRVDAVEKSYKASFDYAQDVEKTQTTLNRDRELDSLREAYLGLFQMVAGGGGNAASAIRWVDLLVRENPAIQDMDQKKIDKEAVANAKKLIHEAIPLAQAREIVKAIEGKGIFRSLTEFNSGCFHTAVTALVWNRDFSQIKTSLWQSAKSVCWLVRFHYVFAIFFIAAWLVIWALIGGAICRITALKIARDEQLGPITALKFSASRFVSFLCAPLLPVGILVLIAMLTGLCSLVGAIPYVGEILVGIFIGLAWVGGFVFALIAIGLVGGSSLMYPTIAVEGSDSFDAISHSFSYLFGRPWRMGFYTVVAAVYGAICYLFVRFFAFLMLASVHGMIGWVVNWDTSSGNLLCGKLDAIWTAPTYTDLNPVVNWASLNGTESFSAFLICLWVCLIVGLVISFLVSFFFTANTTIYFLLRQREDGTDLEDIYLEQNIEELMAEETAPAPASQTQEPSPSAAESQQTPEAPDQAQKEGDGQSYNKNV
jgi:hypothetical protein